MANFVFNIAKGRLAYFASLPAANDALIVIPLMTTGIATDAVMKDFETVAALLAGTTDEQTTMGRKTVNTGVTVFVNHATDTVTVDMPDQTWNPASGSQVSAVLIAYDPDTTGGTDTDLIPLTKHDFVHTPDGGDLTMEVASTGFYGAT